MCIRITESQDYMPLTFLLDSGKRRSNGSAMTISIISFTEQGRLLSKHVKEALRKEVVEELHGFNIKICVFSFNTLTGIEEALDMGVDLVGTHHISIKMLREL